MLQPLLSIQCLSRLFSTFKNYNKPCRLSNLIMSIPWPYYVWKFIAKCYRAHRSHKSFHSTHVDYLGESHKSCQLLCQVWWFFISSSHYVLSTDQVLGQVIFPCVPLWNKSCNSPCASYHSTQQLVWPWKFCNPNILEIPLQLPLCLSFFFVIIPINPLSPPTRFTTSLLEAPKTLKVEILNMIPRLTPTSTTTWAFPLLLINEKGIKLKDLEIILAKSGREFEKWHCEDDLIGKQKQKQEYSNEVDARL